MFADDVASFSDTIIRLQHQINCIERFCLSVCIHLNLIKTKIIVLEMVEYLNKQKSGSI